MPIPKAVNTRLANDTCFRAIKCNTMMKMTNATILTTVKKVFMNDTP